MTETVEPTASGGSGEDLWEHLVAAAVLGTERRPFAAPHVTGPLGPAIASAYGSAGFKGVVAAVWACLEAGRSTRRTTSAVAPAPLDTRPLLPPGTLRSLEAILGDGPLRPVLAEWLALAAADGRRLPPEWIPDVLQAIGPADAATRALLGAAAGPRLTWLVDRNPHWSVPPAASQSDRPQPWSETESRAVLARIAESIRSADTSTAGPLRDSLGAIALALHPAQAPAAAELVASVEQPSDGAAAAAAVFWRRRLSDLAVIVHFRQAMHQEFR